MREGLKAVSCLEQNFGLDVLDGLVCLWLYIVGCVIYFLKRGCCSQVLLIVLVDDVALSSKTLQYILGVAFNTGIPCFLASSINHMIGIPPSCLVKVLCTLLL